MEPEPFIENPTRSSNANCKDMGASEYCRKRFAFCFEVIRLFIDDSMKKTGLPKGGQDMYKYLNHKLPQIFEPPYSVIISKSSDLSEREKHVLLPSDGIINERELNVCTYLKILNLI